MFGIIKKLLGILVLGLLWCNVGFAECIKGDCINGYGTYIWVSGNSWLNGNKYVGEYKNGKPHGLGTYTWANGNKYFGKFKDAKRNGQGTYTFANGTVDKGIWKNNKLIEPN